MEQYFFIEMLWVIPIIGFGVFVSILVFLLHSKFTKENDPDLHRRVEEFNSGTHHGAAASYSARTAAEMEKRLAELDGAVAALTISITEHQKSIASITGAGTASPPTELNQMLDAMRREYDAILHENKTLRTQFMKILRDSGVTPKISQPKTNLRVFDDTRTLTDSFEDTDNFEIYKSNAG